MFTISIAFATVSAQAGADRFTSISPEGASISGFVIDPAKPSTIYAGSTYAGVFKSLDGGESWMLVFDLETLRENRTTQRFIGKLAIDPIRSSTVYATIRTYLPNSNFIGEIVKTEDGGATWSVLPRWPGRDYVIDLVIDPSSPGTLYALDQTDLWQSTNGGLSWIPKSTGLQAVFAGEFRSVAIDPSLPSRLYVGSTRGLYVSNDRGGVWELLRAGADFHRIAVDPADSATLYAAQRDALISSRDSGKTWTMLPVSYVFQIVADRRSSAAYAVVSTVDHVIKILVSTDRGATWTPRPGEGDFPHYSRSTQVHPTCFTGPTGGSSSRPRTAAKTGVSSTAD